MPSFSSAYYVPRRRIACETQPEPRTPAGRIVRLLGGTEATAELAGVARKTVYRWLAARAENGTGTGGRIPARMQERLIASAAARGIALAHVDFAPRPGEAFT